MTFSLSRWRARHLLLAWSVYWLALIVIGLRPALLSALRAVGASDGHGTISASMTNGIVTATVTAPGTSWAGSASLTSLALWIAGPPLLLWLLWLATRRSPVGAREHERDLRTS